MFQEPDSGSAAAGGGCMETLMYISEIQEYYQVSTKTSAHNLVTQTITYICIHIICGNALDMLFDFHVGLIVTYYLIDYYLTTMKLSKMVITS